MIVAFIGWSLTSLIFVAIGIVNWRSNKPVGFFTGVKPSPKKDIKAYNHAVAKIWFFFAAGLEVSGIPILFAEQNSPVILVPVLFPVILIIVIVAVYIRVDAKYK